MNKDGGVVQRGFRSSVLSWTFLICLFSVSAVLSSRVMGDRASAPALPENGNSLLLMVSRRPSFAFGFGNLFADAAWLQAVQVAGTRRLTESDYDRLASLIETVINFDPRFEVPYLMGGLVLGDSPGHVLRALEILERGKRELPAVWRIPFYEGYLRYFAQGDAVAGGMALEQAALVPGSPGYMPLLASRMLAEGRRPETALQLLLAMRHEEADPARQQLLDARIRDVETERDLQLLERAVGSFRQRVGTPPNSLADLVAAGLIPKIPGEPHGGRYFLGIDGTVQSDRMPRRLKVLRPRAHR
jgi:hypothetical protein